MTRSKATLRLAKARRHAGRHADRLGGRHLRPFHWREAMLCVPVLPALILAGVLSGHPIEGATAAGAAFAVGFGAARELRGRRWAAMISATIGMSIAAFLGTLLGQDSIGFIAAAAAVSAGCAALALYDEDIWWVALQVAILFFVAGYYKGDAAAAIDRGLLVLGGSAIEIVVVVALARVFPRAADPIFAATVPQRIDRTMLLVHMARAALCVAISLVAIQRFGLANGYWAPMTALIVLKPRLRDTRTRGLARIGGTLGGCLAATLYVSAWKGDPAALLIGLTCAAGAAFALQKAHYAGLTASITAAIVLLVSLGHGSAVGNAEHRIAATLIGGGLAMLAALIVPRRLPRRRAKADQVGG